MALTLESPGAATTRAGKGESQCVRNFPTPSRSRGNLQPVSSATAGWETLPDGRTKLWVKHEVLKGVTPAMLVWWLAGVVQ